VRSILLLITIAASYALLRGWPENWHAILRVCLAVTALIIAFTLWGRAEKRESAIIAEPTRKPRLLDYLTVGITIFLVECFFLVFLTFAPEKTKEVALFIDEELHPESYPNENENEQDSNNDEALLNDFSQNTGPRVTSNWLFSGPGPRNLNKNDKVTPSNRPELYLFPSSKGDANKLSSNEIYLRTFTLANYRYGAWFPQTTTPRTLTGNGSTITLPRTKTGPSVAYEISHPANIYGQTLAVTVPDFTSIQLPSLRKTSSGTYRLPTSAIQNNSYRYLATSTLFQFDQITDEITPGTSPSPEYLSLPPSPFLREKIETLARTFGPPSRQSLIKLRETLRSRYQYSLDLNMPEEEDALDSFLFKTRVGYCTHFATATTMLTRAMGIPSRIAFGWSGGRYFEEPNLFVFRAREAHAWAEIYLDGLGWVIFETTPATRSEGSSSLAAPNESSPFPSLDLNFNEASESSKLAPLRKIAAGLGLGAAIALLAALLIRRPSNLVDQQSSTSGVLPTPPDYLSAFRRASLAHGHPMPPGRTLRAHLASINAPPFADELLNYHYNVHYGEAPPNKTTEKKLLRELKTWEKDKGKPL